MVQVLSLQENPACGGSRRRGIQGDGNNLWGTQGSVRGPTFFLVYISDIMAEYTKHSSVRLFADDNIIYVTPTAENDCKKLHEDLQALESGEVGS